MINLIPTQQKETNAYVIKNRLLLRWVVAFLIGIGGVWGVVAFGYYQINQSVAVQQSQLSSVSERLEDQDISGISAEIKDIDNSIKLALKVVEQKVLVSKLIQRIGAVIPEGAILLDVSLQDIEGGIDLIARAEDYQSATQVQVNVADPSNNVFEKADIVSVDCASEPSPGSLEAQYPCVINLRALFAKDSEDNPFLFINQNKAEEVDANEQ